MKRIGTQRECLTLLTLNIRLTTRVNQSQYWLSNGKELGNEYIATEAEALKEESVVSVAEFIWRLMC